MADAVDPIVKDLAKAIGEKFDQQLFDKMSLLDDPKQATALAYMAALHTCIFAAKITAIGLMHGPEHAGTIKAMTEANETVIDLITRGMRTGMAILERTQRGRTSAPG